ncbi:MAG: 4Fe-4S dicluster domain-containing protein [Deltaproteobacteria bacterium]|nr:4Fe-4S dicluster domain-containing protein [Deltaproteobacteria bacterium]
MTIKHMSILTDVTKCIGCEKCVDACQEANNLPTEKPWRWLKKITDLSSARFTTLVKMNSGNGNSFVRRQCRHCLEPACVEACIVGALKKTPEGAVVYDSDICIGCRYCMIACPWEIPRYSWEESVPYVQKCHMCYERVTNDGKAPACVEACPTKATIFGERDELLAEAKRRIGAHPDKYIQKIWGEHEVGGTSVLYISDVDINLTDLEKPISDKTPMPSRTFKVLGHMPSVFVGMAAAMGGIYWIIERRQKLASQDTEKTDDTKKDGS